MMFISVGRFSPLFKIIFSSYFPLWFEEGLAEFLAQGWDTQTDMYMRDAVLNNYLPPLPQLSGFLSYRGGQSFWYFIADQYGQIGRASCRVHAAWAGAAGQL